MDVLEVKSEKPAVEFVTIKLNRYEALEVLDLYKSTWRRNNYFFRFDGKPSIVHTALHRAVHGEELKLKPGPVSFNDVMNAVKTNTF